MSLEDVFDATFWCSTNFVTPIVVSRTSPNCFIPTMPRRRMSRRPRRRRRRTFRRRRRFRRVRALDPELKFDDQAATLTPIVNTPGLILMNGIAIGISENQRIGNQIRIVSFGFRLTVALNTSDTATTQVRIMLLLDKQTPSANPNESQLLQNVNTPIESNRRIDFARRFHVFYDRVINVNNVRNFTSFRQFWKRRTVIARYLGTAQNIADIASSALFLFAWSDQPTTATAPSIDVQCRTRYVG